MPGLRSLIRRPGRSSRPTTVESDDPERLGETVAQLTVDKVDRNQRRRLLGRLIAGLGRSAKKAGVAGVSGGRWLTDLVIETVPHVPVRDLPTLQAHHGRSDW